MRFESTTYHGTHGVHADGLEYLEMQGRAERQEAVEQGRAQSWFLQQALAPLLPQQLPFVLRFVADTLGAAGPTAMHALNAAVLAASSANIPLTHIVAGGVIWLAHDGNLNQVTTIFKDAPPSDRIPMNKCMFQLALLTST